VLIVGGSLVGLSTALFLRLHGVSCLAVERHASTAIHPVSDPQRRFADAYGIGGAGVVLVRPDGVVGWRALDATRASKAVVGDALRSLLGLEAV